ncbi:MAG: hypothetical protein KKF44_08550, partial [Nanoarchaeota archaeon]|nr:hypothetical protein [Nanoarchaeota archaeon]
NQFMEYFENIEKIKVEKIVEYDPFTDKTKITIKINVEPPVNNLEYYEYIPKCIIQQVNDISLPSSPLIIKDDPLVMWDFGDVSDVNTREIAYLRDKKKLTETCEKIMESFAKGDGSRISSGIIGRQRSRYQHNDNDGISNGEDIFPDDSDDDGFPDVWEAQYSFDVDDSTSPGNFLIPGTDIPRDLSSYTVISFEIDKDGDGLSDYREYKFGSSPIKIDTDNDGVNDNIEFFFMLDPNCRDSERAHGVNPGSFEWWNSPCSGDGMPDLWEVEHSSVTIPTGPLYGEVEFVDFPDEYSIRSGGLNPHIDDSNFDFDFDGLTNIEEYLSGTDPQDQASSVECPGNHDDCGNLKGKGICGNCIGCEWDYEEDGCVNEDIIPNTACILQTESTCIGNCIWCAPMIYNTYTILQGVCLPENKNCYCDIAGLNCDSSCDMPGLTEIQKEDCNKQCCSRCDDSDMCPVGCTDDDDACESIY